MGALMTKIRVSDSGKLDTTAGSDTDFISDLGLPTRYCWLQSGDMDA